MCGIFSLLNVVDNQGNIVNDAEEAFYYGRRRGPESSIYNTDFVNNFNAIFGFHRLAINLSLIHI